MVELCTNPGFYNCKKFTLADPQASGGALPQTREWNYLSDKGISSVRLTRDEDSKGIEVCLYRGANLTQWQWTCIDDDPTTNNKPDNADLWNGPDDAVHSIKIRKICSNPKWVWDDDCWNSNLDKVVEGCTEGTSCYRVRKEACSPMTTDLAAHANCKRWCQLYPGDCPNSINAYCTAKKGTTGSIENDPLCRTNASAYNAMCSNTGMLQYGNCRDWCNTSANIGACEASIKAYCTGASLGTAWCEAVLARPEMRGKHDDVMSSYCATAAGRARPLCNCLNKPVIDAYFSAVPDAEARMKFTARPECTYDLCTMPGTYKPPVTPCESIQICKAQVGNVTFMPGSSNNVVELINKCTTAAPAAAPAGAGTPGPSGSSSGSGAPRTSPAAADPEAASDQQAQLRQKRKTTVIIIVVVVLCVVMALLAGGLVMMGVVVL